MNIKDIANLAGVSVATVSRVINGNTNVKPLVRESILRIIEEHNYVPNSIGISLLKKKSNTIGIILPAVHSYYTERFNAIAEMCMAKGYGNIVSVTGYHEANEISALIELRAKNVDGVIFITNNITERHLEILRKYTGKVPLVIIDSDGTPYGFSSIVHDDYGGALQAMNYLIECGHRNIAFIGGGELNSSSTCERYRAYNDTMSSIGVPQENRIVVSGNYSMSSGYEAVDTILSFSQKPTAIFCANDNMALGASRRIIESGYKIPDDISIVGVDDLEPMKYLPCSLTTVRQELRKSGQEAAALLFSEMTDKSTSSKKIVMNQSLIIRESVRKI